MKQGTWTLSIISSLLRCPYLSPPPAGCCLTHACTCCRYDTEEGGELFNALSSNERVQATSTGFRYLSKFGIKDKQSLLKHIRDCPTGLRSIDFKDSYT